MCVCVRVYEVHRMMVYAHPESGGGWGRHQGAWWSCPGNSREVLSRVGEASRLKL